MPRKRQKSRAAIIGMNTLEFKGAYGLTDKEKSGNPGLRKTIFFRSLKKTKRRSAPLIH
ncbi:MAG: hypothetical protein ACFFBS_08780 [Promethearchaeota archaeon]